MAEILISQDKMAKARLREGSRSDTDWLYALFRETNRNLIDAAWGWDEVFQREAFLANLPGHRFTILELDLQPAGGYHISRKPSHLLLDLLLVRPECQRQGWGSLLLAAAKDRGRTEGLPLKLSVLKANPARHFYTASGFRISEEDRTSLKMEWSPEFDPVAAN